MTAVFSPDVCSRAAAVPPSFSAASPRARAGADADDQQPSDAPVVVDELLGDARPLAFEALAVERRVDRLLRSRRAQPSAERSLPATGSTSA